MGTKEKNYFSQKKKSRISSQGQGLKFTNISPGPKLVMDSISTLKELLDSENPSEEVNHAADQKSIYWIECNVNDYTYKKPDVKL